MLSSDKIGFARTSGLGRVALVGLGEPVVSHTEKVIFAATVCIKKSTNAVRLCQKCSLFLKLFHEWHIALLQFFCCSN